MKAELQSLCGPVLVVLAALCLFHGEQLLIYESDLFIRLICCPPNQVETSLQLYALDFICQELSVLDVLGLSLRFCAAICRNDPSLMPVSKELFSWSPSKFAKCALR